MNYKISMRVICSVVNLHLKKISDKIGAAAIFQTLYENNLL